MGTADSQKRISSSYFVKKRGFYPLYSSRKGLLEPERTFTEVILKNVVILS